MRSDEEGFLARRTGDADGEVVRMKLADTGAWMEVSTHTVKGRKCDCDGFKFRHTCAHVSALFVQPQTTKPLDLPDARNLADTLLITFKPGLRLAPESYEWIDGKVVGISLITKGAPGPCAGVIGGVRVTIRRPV